MEETLQNVGLKTDTVYVPANGQFVTAILREMEFEILANPEKNTELTMLKYRELLIKLSRAVYVETVDSQLKPAVKSHLRQVRSRIFSKLGYDWSVKEMAELAYMSTSRFHTVYRAAFGISPMDDLIHARIDTAKNRLCNSNESVNGLAAELGYKNVTHFCRQFKKFTGMTPMEFRKTQAE